MSPILISVIVPVYNVEKYLRKCLDSIINQTYQNIEIILVDDGSKDTSGQICDEYALKDSRIIVIHKENGGLSSARNAGLDIAKGNYVMFVDSDDYVEPQFCEIPLKLALEKGVDIVTFGYNKVFEDGHNWYRRTNTPRLIESIEGIREIIVKNDIIFSFAWNKLYKLSLFNDVNYPIGKIYEDQATTYLLFHKAQRIYVTDAILYNYVYRESSISADWDRPEAIETRFQMWLERLEFVRKYYPENESVQINQLVDEGIKGFLRLTGIMRYKKAVSMFSHFMDNNKKVILTLREDKIIKLYYLNKYIFYLSCIYYRYRFLK